MNCFVLAYRCQDEIDVVCMMTLISLVALLFSIACQVVYSICLRREEVSSYFLNSAPTVKKIDIWYHPATLGRLLENVLQLQWKTQKTGWHASNLWDCISHRHPCQRPRCCSPLLNGQWDGHGCTWLRRTFPTHPAYEIAVGTFTDCRQSALVPIGTIAFHILLPLIR